MMTGSRWIKMSFFLMLLLQFTVTGQYVSFTVRDGEDTTLPCHSVRDNQDQCSGTTLTLGASGTSAPVELILYGKISGNRLSLTENCSLVIKKVTVEDAGLYVCQQSGSGTDQFYLSVVTMTEHKDDHNVTLTCSVWTHGDCRHTVKWLKEGKAVDKQNHELRTPQSDCSATVTVLTSATEKSKYDELFKCEVTDINNSEGSTAKVQQFTFNHQTSGEAPKETTPPSTRPTPGEGAKQATTTSTPVKSRTAATTTQSTTTKSPTKSPTVKPTTKSTTKSTTTSTTKSTSPTINLETSSPASSGWWGFIVVPVLLAVIVVMIVRWKKTKVTKTQVDANSTDPEDGVSYATMTFMKKSNSKAVVEANDCDDEGDAVTYSKVKAPSSSAGAATDPSMLYATINTPVK